MNGSGLVYLKRHPLEYQATSQRNFSLTKHEGSAWWTVYFRLTRGTKMVNTELNLEEKESSTVWDSGMGSYSEAPRGAAGQSPVEQREGGTPMIEGEHLSSSSQTPENLEGLTETVSTLGLQVSRRNRCGDAKGERGRPCLQRLLLGTQAAANLGPLQAVKRKSSKARHIWGSIRMRICFGSADAPRERRASARPRQTAAVGRGHSGRRAGREAQAVWAAWVRQSHSGGPPDGCCW